ncbi:4'-phosphopantetheinyl transferase superfamily protein [Desulfobacula sp.]|uniref:4'-phosphopantetheinyl transferase superfamily protein n=1 Tax=Desulfobacula sp. TaxID=2593537 RepID=UPI0025B93395|nr:4'-phosphopantetheinyl transferase superfamily protein [Desulfobacula sp.]MBC2703595.1 4'-phosphopantetheinyl transferase superfamily protein [Desulfobacula sp.]
MPETIKILKGKKKVVALSQFARESARVSALKAKLHVDIFEKDTLGVPRLSNGLCWSVSHKPDFVAGVVSKEKIGIDLERIKDISDALFERIIEPEEERHFRHQGKSTIFFRVFTAKEAVLKKTRDGIRGLPKVKIKEVVDEKNLVVQYIDKKYLVENFYFDGYLASVTKDHFNVQWTLE